MFFRRTIQIFSLAVFLVLLLAAATGLAWEGLDFFLRLDPALVLVSALGARTLAWAFAPAVLVLLTCLLAGRVFCSHICPMGTTLDAADWLLGCERHPQVMNRAGGLRTFKYLVLGFLAGAAALNISVVFLAAPLSLITRFYGLIVYPLGALGIDTGIRLVQPLAEALDLTGAAFLHVRTPRFATQFFVLAFFCLLFAAAAVSPRFWCRTLCPAGAMMALFSRKPIVRRKVGDLCTDCGQCAQSCPMGAIEADAPHVTAFGECISCGTCQYVCPQQAVVFSTRHGARARTVGPASMSRRRFLAGGAAGAGVAAVGLTGLASPLGEPGEGHVLPPGLVRPPGTRPEIDFLSRCVRCAECVSACPTNTLQPIWLSAGLLGLFSPALTPRRGYCDPRCHRCAEVCPTGAIRRVALPDRVWAKTGTAVIERQRCLAWEHQKSCMVCDEVCPFDAIEFKRQAGNRFAVPHVQENRCAGCGFCEHYCPVNNRAAIVVSPMGALRRNRGAFEDVGKQQGLDLRLKATPGGPSTADGTSIPAVDLAPGFDPE